MLAPEPNEFATSASNSTRIARRHTTPAERIGNRKGNRTKPSQITAKRFALILTTPTGSIIGVSHGEIWANTQIAISDFSLAIRIDSDWAAAYFHRGWSWELAENFDLAIRDYTEAIKLVPNYAHAFRNRGYALHKKGNLDKAIADETDAIRLDPAEPQAYINRAAIWEDKNNREQALRDLHAAISSNPESAAAFVSRGKIAELKGDYDQAMRDYLVAMERGFSNFSPDSRQQILAWNEKADPQKARAVDGKSGRSATPSRQGTPQADRPR